MKRTHWIIPIVACAYATLIPLNYLAAQLAPEHPVLRMGIAQLLALCLAGVVLFSARRLNPEGFRKYWGLGNSAAPAQAVPLLGIKAGESWRSAGTGFSVAVTAITGWFMWNGVYRDQSIDWWGLLPWVLLFAASNAFTEEMIGRVALAAGLDGQENANTICWWSAAIFGGIHFFGTPGGITGVLMAGFLGWLLAKSVLETRGFGWAWWIHFLQDVVIIFALLR